MEPGQDYLQKKGAKRQKLTQTGKAMGVFCSMDRMIGKEFETGLANLKTLAEK